MKRQVQFLLSSNKNEVNLKEQMIAINNKLTKEGLVHAIINKEEDLWDSSVEQAISFIGKENKHSSEWKITLTKNFSFDVEHLEVVISSDEYINKVENNYLEKLKITVKNSLKDYWKNVYWLYDKDSEILSTDLYPGIYAAENLARQFINTLMVQNYGTDWWGRLAPEKLKKSHQGRVGAYKSLVENFVDVDDKLMSIDTGDLIDLMKIKTYKWVPGNEIEINEILNSGRSDISKDLAKLIINQSKVDINVWDGIFSKYLTSEFSENFETFVSLRNHVMHNKLIDREAYKSISNSARIIHDELSNALTNEKLLRELKGEPSKISFSSMFEKSMEVDYFIKHLESADEEVSEWLGDFGIILRRAVDLRSYLSFEDLNERMGPDGYNELYKIKRNVDQAAIVVSYQWEHFISSQENSNCPIHLKFEIENELIDIFLIDYITEVYFDYGEVGSEEKIRYTGKIYFDVEEMINISLEILDSVLKNPIKKAEEESHYSIIDGGKSSIMEFVYCENCGLESIYGGEEIAEYGQCLECGYKNEITECTRCGTSFVGPQPTEEIPSPLCSNCLEMIHDE